MTQEELIKQIVGNTEGFIRAVQETDSVLNNTIEPFPENIEALRQYAVSAYWSHGQIVNVFEVIGTAHADYIGATWITMLRLGKRMRSINLPLLQENPQYYCDLAQKEPEMHYTRLNGKLFISGEGNHRTAIAKALFAFLGWQNFGAVKYEELWIDEEAMRLCGEAQQLILQKGLPMLLEPRRTAVKREDTPGWKKDFYDLSFRLANAKTGREKILSRAELREFCRALDSASWWSRVARLGQIGKFLV